LADPDLLKFAPAERRRRRRSRAPILKPYVDTRSWRRRLVIFTYPFALALFCIIYGFFFALTAPYLILFFAMPVALLAAMAIWALPSSASAPTRTMEFFFASLFIGLILWPNYLAISFPGLPWITVIRLTGFPMLFLFLVSLSASDRFRHSVSEALHKVPIIWMALIVFVAIQFITIPFAKAAIGTAFQRALIEQVNWTCVFVVSAYIFQTPGRAEKYVGLLMALGVPIILIAIPEAMQEEVLWRNHVPSFLKVDDAVAQIILQASVRGATGLYRAKATFSTALGLSEFMALLVPFAIHYATNTYRLPVRIFGAAMIPILFFVIRLTDSRLGLVGFLISFLLYLLLWSMRRFRRNRRDLLAATVVYAYPAFFLASVGAVLTFHKLNVLVFGGGAQADSNEARKLQLVMGVPKILLNPLGHGPGMSGTAMGYGEGQFVTVDNYYLTAGLEYGVIGLACFFTMFLTAIGLGAKYAVQTAHRRDSEMYLLAPLAVALAEFLVIKSVFSQEDNHSLLFLFLGMTVALVARARADLRREQELAGSVTRPAPARRRLPSLASGAR